jgi:hypothetical protein
VNDFGDIVIMTTQVEVLRTQLAEAEGQRDRLKESIAITDRNTRRMQEELNRLRAFATAAEDQVTALKAKLVRQQAYHMDSRQELQEELSKSDAQRDELQRMLTACEEQRAETPAPPCQHVWRTEGGRFRCAECGQWEHDTPAPTGGYWEGFAEAARRDAAILDDTRAELAAANETIERLKSIGQELCSDAHTVLLTDMQQGKEALWQSVQSFPYEVPGALDAYDATPDLLKKSHRWAGAPSANAGESGSATSMQPRSAAADTHAAANKEIARLRSYEGRWKTQLDLSAKLDGENDRLKEAHAATKAQLARVMAILPDALLWVEAESIKLSDAMPYEACIDEIKAILADADSKDAGEAWREGGRVCSTCNDTHLMSLGDDEVMCTRCPRPCQKCRVGGNGAYCSTTPCACDCHGGDS